MKYFYDTEFLEVQTPRIISMTEPVVVKGIDTKCPCCGETNLDAFKRLFEYYDNLAEKAFERQNETGAYRDEPRRREFQAKADVLLWVIERLEGRGAACD